MGISKDSDRISAMFDGIASDYDRLNHILSFGTDIIWRKKMLRRACVAEGMKVLDIACGTGDMSFALASSGADVTGIDISAGMLEVAEAKKKKRRAGNVVFMNASAESIPFEDESFDVVTISFGIRNFDRRMHCLSEIFRVIRPGGKLLILEFAIPRNRVWRAIYGFYFRKLTPVVGEIVSGSRSAYEYLPDSVMEFPKYEDFCRELKDSGFSNTNYVSLTGGISVLYIGEKS